MASHLPEYSRAKWLTTVSNDKTHDKLRASHPKCVMIHDNALHHYKQNGQQCGYQVSQPAGLGFRSKTVRAYRPGGRSTVGTSATNRSKLHCHYNARNKVKTYNTKWYTGITFQQKCMHHGLQEIQGNLDQAHIINMV